MKVSQTKALFPLFFEKLLKNRFPLPCFQPSSQWCAKGKTNWNRTIMSEKHFAISNSQDVLAYDHWVILPLQVALTGQICSIMLQPHNMIALAGQGIRLLCRWHKHMNRMLWSKVFDNLNRGNHVAISRYNNGNITAFREQIYKHTSSYPNVWLFLLVGLVLEAAILALELLFL